MERIHDGGRGLPVDHPVAVAEAEPRLAIANEHLPAPRVAKLVALEAQQVPVLVVGRANVAQPPRTAVDRGRSVLVHHLLVGLHEGRQVRHCLFHHAGGLDHLGQEHLTGTEQVAYDSHAVHERPFDHPKRAGADVADRGLEAEQPVVFGVRDQELVGSFLVEIGKELARHRRAGCGMRDGGDARHQGGDGDQRGEHSTAGQ